MLPIVSASDVELKMIRDYELKASHPRMKMR